MLAILCSSYCHWLFLPPVHPGHHQSPQKLGAVLLLLCMVRQAQGTPKSSVVTISILVLGFGSYGLGGECLKVFRLTIF